MASFEVKAFSSADETRRFPHGRVELLNVPGGTIGRVIFEPGWRWSTDVQPSEACVCLDMVGMARYAKASPEKHPSAEGTPPTH